MLPEQSKTLFIWRFPCVSALYHVIEVKQQNIRNPPDFLFSMFIVYDFLYIFI